MSEKSYKTGDILQVHAKVMRVTADGNMHVKIGQAHGWTAIKPEDVVKVERYAIKVGDRVKWYEQEQWCFGTVLGLEVDQEPTAKAHGRIWAWVKEDIRWPRRTFDVKQLTRV